VSVRARCLVAAFTVVAVIASAPAASGDAITDSIVSADAVARVGDGFIARSQFNRWFGVAASGNPAIAGATAASAYDAPDYAGCVKAKRNADRNPPSLAVLKLRCKREYEGLRDQVLEFLILERWVYGETLERGSGPSDAQLEVAFQKAKHSTFPSDADFQKFLKRSGMTEDDARFQVAFNERYVSLREAAIANAAPVTDDEIAAFYNKHKRRFALPQSRDVRVVLTKTLGRAYAALAALRRGRFWRRVAEKYSIDRATKHGGGILRGVTKGSQEKALDDAIFRAPKDKLRGPVKTHFGYWVFRVFKITPARQQTLAQSSPAIRQELTAQRQQAADEKFNKDFRAKWRPRTTCREGFRISMCVNGPPAAPE
jgi:foldase protein PrsA